MTCLVEPLSQTLFTIVADHSCYLCTRLNCHKSKCFATHGIGSQIALWFVCNAYPYVDWTTAEGAHSSHPVRTCQSQYSGVGVDIPQPHNSGTMCSFNHKQRKHKKKKTKGVCSLENFDSRKTFRCRFWCLSIKLKAPERLYNSFKSHRWTNFEKLILNQTVREQTTGPTHLSSSWERCLLLLPLQWTVCLHSVQNIRYSAAGGSRENTEFHFYTGYETCEKANVDTDGGVKTWYRVNQDIPQ